MFQWCIKSIIIVKLIFTVLKKNYTYLKVIEVIPHKKLVLKAKFPASIARLKLIFEIEENDKGFLFSESDKVGFNNRLLCFWNYIIKKRLFNK